MKYIGLVQWTAGDGSIKLDLLGDDDQVHSIEIATECAGVLVAALGAEAEKLNPEGSDQQFIRPTGMQTGQTAAGEPVLMMRLKGGTELPLVFKTAALDPLISELEKLRRVLQPGGQVRWN